MLSKSEKLNEMISKRYDVSIDFNSPMEHLLNIIEMYEQKRKQLVMEGKDITDAEYAKVTLIAETVRIYLKEIAPKRTKRRKK